MDSRNLRGGDRLNPAIAQAIRGAERCLVVLSPRTVNSPWVRREIRQAEAVAREREGFRVVPLLLDGIEPSALELWFDQEPVGVSVTLDTTGLDQAFPGILAALGYLQEARRRYEALGQAGEHMASVCLTEQGDCLAALGRLDEAAASYEEAIALDAKAGRDRDVAAGKFQLGTVRMLQKRYPEALEAYAEARRSFEALGELGNLYDAMGRLEQAVNCYRQAAEISVELQDLRYEAVTRSNLADTFVKLGRLPEAAAEARRQAVAAYLAYRRDGGESQVGGMTVQVCEQVAQAIAEGATDQASKAIARLAAEPDNPAYLQPLIPKLQAILQGARDPDLADDPALDYDDAAELTLLLERLGQA